VLDEYMTVNTNNISAAERSVFNTLKPH